MKQVNEYFYKEWNVYDPNAKELPMMDGIPRLKSTNFAKLTKSSSNNYSIRKGGPR